MKHRQIDRYRKIDGVDERFCTSTPLFFFTCLCILLQVAKKLDMHFLTSKYCKAILIDFNQLDCFREAKKQCDADHTYSGGAGVTADVVLTLVLLEHLYNVFRPHFCLSVVGFSPRQCGFFFVKKILFLYGFVLCNLLIPA